MGGKTKMSNELSPEASEQLMRIEDEMSTLCVQGQRDLTRGSSEYKEKMKLLHAEYREVRANGKRL